MNQHEQMLLEARAYLKQAAQALGVTQIDTEQPLLPQRKDILISIGEKVADQTSEAHLKPYKVFWAVADQIMKIEERNPKRAQAALRQ